MSRVRVIITATPASSPTLKQPGEAMMIIFREVKQAIKEIINTHGA